MDVSEEAHVKIRNMRDNPDDCPEYEGQEAGFSVIEPEETLFKKILRVIFK